MWAALSNALSVPNNNSVYGPTPENELVGELRKYLWFWNKAEAVRAAGHGTLAAIWRQVTLQQLQGRKDTVANWMDDIVTANQEEARFVLPTLGRGSRVDYWSLMKRTLEKDPVNYELAYLTQEIAYFTKESLSLSMRRQLQEAKQDHRSFYRARGREASARGWKELAALWEQVEGQVEDGNRRIARRHFLTA
jgi:hypothetical protein